MSFYERHGIVRATQWHKHGDHPRVGRGVHEAGGTLDIAHAAPYSRRHVEATDWVITESDGRHVVVTDAEFRHIYKGI